MKKNTPSPFFGCKYLLDALIQDNSLKNDAALCRVLRFAPPMISKIRHGKVKISADVILRIHEILNVPVLEIRRLIALDDKSANRSCNKETN